MSNKGKRIVIVGAGPAGLVTALGLARQGAQVTVIDREDDILRWPRAMVYLPSTLKVLDEIGLLDKAKSVAAWGYEYNLRFPLTGNIGRLDYHLIEDLTPYSFNLHFGQDVLAEMILEEFLKLPGAQMRWKTSFDTVEQAEDCIQVALHTPDGPRTIEADWLVGADGARSSVRKDIGVAFDGFTWDDTFMATNVLYDFDQYGYAPSTMIADPDHWCVIAKIDDKQQWRIAYGEDSSLTEEARLARIKERFKQFLPDADAPLELLAANSYRVHQRSASTYRVGRVFLAGDAAHATNPIGGMGFTSGVQDAHALIKYLGGVINGTLAEDALDWYAHERRRCFLQIANPTAIEFKRRTQERDTARRMEDEANMFALMADREMSRQAMMSIFNLTGRGYQEDWQTTLLVEDEAGQTPALGAHGGVKLKA
ncbi:MULTISPECIES: FAD-dependent oxidoreductase [unclassified Pseudomonas]|jgi:2-polyprenyl-6-methoxyphenol hydroxylase-like FAD-dependent oxidoreductase|uniref:FAD-dependent oxidoreductase n=1 Tax=unclassified Pseudomonas TaxID=196821 RepID=UPI00069F3E45|nr:MULTISPECIES: FAD-dependent oxidoreductase [unclassified Pseudomonas]WPN49667.1 FAD-dependent oxidoreductase [Pseudomonas sp. P8_241]